MSHLRMLKIGLAFCVGLLLANIAHADDYTQLTRNYRDYCLGRAHRASSRRSVNPETTLELARALRPDGSWADVNYTDQTRGGWLPYQHLSRVLGMVRACVTPGTPLAGNAELRAAIHKALGYWLERDFQCSNWWYNVIGVPQTVGEIGILFQEELTPEEYEGIVNKILPRGKIGMTGQNRVWVAGITLVRGLLAKNGELVRQAAAVLGEEIRITTEEGVQPDFSFHQHGPQQQFGNYGLSFASSSAMWVRVFDGTPFEFPKEKLDILHDYLIQGENWIVWRGRMDLSSCGRQLDEGCQAGKARGLASSMELMRQADAARAGDYEAYLRRNAEGGANDLTGNRHFWRSDYMIQRGAEYYASVKMASRRVTGGELVNSENMSGYHLADGALLLHRDGTEYEDIQPVWDWCRIPGTTAPQRAGGPPRLSRRYNIDSDFVGGVSDGAAGCAALDYNRDGVRAKKAWFFIGDAIVCLGAGIAAEKGDEPIATTVNQCLLKGEVWAGGADGKKLARGEHRLAGPAWVWHDGVGYVFPKGVEANVRLGEQRGSWRRVEDKAAVSKREITRDVLQITIDHGTKPEGKTYAYMILPAGTKPESMAGTIGKGLPKIVENTPRLQAVQAGGEIQAVFYEPGKLEKTEVAQPCLVMRSGKKLTVADPTQKLKEIVANGRAVALPQGGEAGRSVAAQE